MPDFVLYEAAVLDGRTVLALPIAFEVARTAAIGVPTRGRRSLRELLRPHRDQEITPWRGAQMDSPALLRR